MCLAHPHPVLTHRGQPGEGVQAGGWAAYLRLVGAGVVVEVQVELLGALRPELVQSPARHARLPVGGHSARRHGEHMTHPQVVKGQGLRTARGGTYLNEATESITLSMPVSLFSYERGDDDREQVSF